MYSLLYLWEKRTLYITDCLGLITVNQAASSLLIGLTKPFEFWTPNNGKVKTQVALIPPGKTLSIDHFDQPVAVCYLDPLNADYQKLKPLMKQEADGVLYDSEYLDVWRHVFDEIYQNQLTGGQAYLRLMAQVLGVGVTSISRARHFAAVEHAVEIIKKNPTENISNFELAERVGLSEFQLQRQFKIITGIPIRRFRLWHRLFVTATMMGFGMSLTDASIAAGFSDSSHFNRTFKSILGLKPSFVLKRRDHTKIFLGGDQVQSQSDKPSPEFRKINC